MPRLKNRYLAALILITTLFLSATGNAVEMRISGVSYSIQSFEENNITYLSFSEIVEQFGGLLDWDVVGYTVTYAEDTNHFTFMIDSPFLNRNDSLFNMTYPSLLKKGQLYVPAETFVPLWNEVVFQKIVWDKLKNSLVINSDYYNINDIALTEKANGLLIELFLSRTMAYDIFVTEGNWINISVRDGIVNQPQILSRKNRRYMYELKAHQANGSAQVSLRLNRKITKWHHKLENDPPRIQISIADVNFEMADGDSNIPGGPDNKIDVIVIDAGHGGSQYGAVGPGGTREKDIALDIAKELAKLIRKDKEFKVIMTRDQDKTVSLDKRAEIANAATCDLFISIHANSSVKKHVRGWNVFFLAQAKNDSARSVAQFENSSFLRDMSSDSDSDEVNYENVVNPIDLILNEMLLTEFQTESHDFALMLDREFRKNLEIPARGVDQAGFFVLNKIYSPSVLLETGFISNKDEEKMLKSGKYQKNVAKAVYEAIKRFKAKYEN